MDKNSKSTACKNKWLMCIPSYKLGLGVEKMNFKHQNPKQSSVVPYFNKPVYLTYESLLPIIHVFYMCTTGKQMFN